MAADLTTLERVAAGWRPLTDAEAVVAATRIGAASRLLRRLVPSVDDRVDSGDLDADLVSDVVAEAVIRVMKNPDGIRQVSYDDYSETRDREVSAGLLQFLDSELALLQPADRPSGAFTISPYGGRSWS